MTKIVAFLCNWCSYEASVRAGSKRLPMPSDVLIVRVMCTGMINPQSVIGAFADGADGVVILGCHPGDCHYQQGNIHAFKRTTLLKQLLPQWGIDPNRLVLDWVSASESDKFSKVITEASDGIRALGPIERSTAVQG